MQNRFKSCCLLRKEKYSCQFLKMPSGKMMLKIDKHEQVNPSSVHRTNYNKCRSRFITDSKTKYKIICKTVQIVFFSTFTLYFKYSFEWLETRDSPINRVNERLYK